MLARSLIASFFFLSACVKITTDDQRGARAQPAPTPVETKRAVEPKPTPTPTPTPSEAPTPTTDAAPVADAVQGFDVREPVAAEPIGVKQIEAGAEPRERLAIAGTVGEHRKLRIELGLSAAMHVGTRDVPPTKLPALQVVLDTEVLEVTDLRTTVGVVVTEVIVPSDASSSTRVQQAITRTADELRATKGKIVLAADGRIESFALAGEGVAGKQPGLEPELGGLAAALQEMLPLVPSEPIGDGARWRAVQQVKRDTVTLQQVAEWTAKRDGDALVLTASSEHVVVAPPSGIVEAQSGTTRAKLVWDPKGPLPRSAEAEVSTTTRAHLELVGAAQRVSMRVELSLRLADAAG